MAEELRAVTSRCGYDHTWPNSVAIIALRWGIDWKGVFLGECTYRRMVIKQ